MWRNGERGKRQQDIRSKMNETGGRIMIMYESISYPAQTLACKRIEKEIKIYGVSCLDSQSK